MTIISTEAQRRQDEARRGNGRFGEQLHSTPEAAIRSVPSLVDAIDESYPVPQANNIESVGAAVSAVASDVNTPSSVAQALDMDDRQGAYYLNAAGYLGLVEQDADFGGGAAFWRLTALGDEYSQMDAGSRASLLMELAESTPAVAGFRDGGIEGASDAIAERSELGDDTIKRRASTAASWAASIDAHDFTTGAARIDEEARGRFATAALTAKSDRDAFLASRAPKEPEVCTECWLQIPASGVCPNCV